MNKTANMIKESAVKRLSIPESASDCIPSKALSYRILKEENGPERKTN